MKCSLIRTTAVASVLLAAALITTLAACTSTATPAAGPSPQNYTISVKVIPTGAGTTTGGGQFRSGQTVTVTASANSGYAFADWSMRGITVSVNQTYSFQAQGNDTLTADFVITRGTASAASSTELTDHTKAMLDGLTQPIKVICFFVPSQDKYGLVAYETTLLGQYQSERPNLITIETLNPEQHPDIARQYGVTQYQTVVFESENRHQLVQPSQVTQFDSQGNPQSFEAQPAFDNAIVEVIGVAQQKVYFLTGDQEADINGSYSDAVAGLRNDLYSVDTLNLITTPKIPSDCAALIIAAPQAPLSGSEINVISGYLASGGQVFILTDPSSDSSFNGLDKIVSPWGVDLKNGAIIDPTSNVASENVPLVPPDRDFFQSTGLQLSTYFPDAAAVIAHSNTSFAIQPLVWTSTSSYLIPNYDPVKDPNPTYDASQDTKGPLSIGALVTAPASRFSNPNPKLTRLIVVGDSDFANNTNYSQVNNGDFFLDCVNWLVK